MFNNLVLKKGADADAFEKWLQEEGIAYERVPGLYRHFRVEGWPEHGDVLAIEEDVEHKGDSQPLTLSPDMAGAWQLARVIRRDAPYPRAPWKQDYSSFFTSNIDGTGVDIYIIDSGVSRDVTELLWDAGRFSRWVNIVADTGTNGDDNGHGTACACLAAGGVHGIARGATISSYKCLDQNGSGTTTNIVSAFGHALSDYNGRTAPGVISCSISGTGTSTSVVTAIGDCIDAGMVVCISAGNDHKDMGTFDNLYAEADADSVVVGGIMYDDWSYFDGRWGTNWGHRVDILSPAKLTQTALATDAGGGPAATRLFSGTSAACPITAGVMACYLQGIPRLTGRAQVQAAKAHLLNMATQGRARFHPETPVLPDRIVYLNPEQTVNVIPGVNA